MDWQHLLLTTVFSQKPDRKYSIPSGSPNLPTAYYRINIIEVLLWLSAEQIIELYMTPPSRNMEMKYRFLYHVAYNHKAQEQNTKAHTQPTTSAHARTKHKSTHPTHHTCTQQPHGANEATTFSWNSMKPKRTQKLSPLCRCYCFFFFFFLTFLSPSVSRNMSTMYWRFWQWTYKETKQKQKQAQR